MMRIARDFISGLRIKLKSFGIPIQGPALHMVIMVPWLRIKAFMNWHLIRSTIWSIIILFANQLQLGWWELQKKTQIQILLMHLLSYCIQIESGHCCNFSRTIRLINWEFYPHDGFSCYWYTSEVLSWYQVFLLVRFAGSILLAYLRIASMNQFLGSISIRNMTVGWSPYQLCIPSRDGTWIFVLF